ncbi:MAG: tetratricopeptide repeat protein [Synergistes sp.]|nr:tetratricopeptide repeat protein [Synergistes sp.]
MKETTENIDSNVNVICPENVPEEQKGLTEEEKDWVTNEPPKPKVPMYVFAVTAAVIFAAFAGGGIWYYRINVLPEKYNMRADSLMKEKDFTAAEQLYRKILAIRPERRDVLFNIALCREEQGNTTEAIEYYMEHLKTAKNDVRAMTRIGRIYMKSGNYGDASRWLKEASRRDKKDKVIWHELADAAEKSGDINEACNAWSHIAELSSEQSDILACAKKLYALRDYGAAVEAYKKVIKNDFENKDAKHGLIAARSMLGLPTELKFVIVPGKSLGLITIGASKDEVKSAVGRTPDEKEFRTSEVWRYYIGNTGDKVTVVFTEEKVSEIKTSSAMYKTEDGLSVSNFLLPKKKDFIASRTETESGTLVCTVKGDGLTFYAKGLNEEGTDAKMKFLRVHKAKGIAEMIGLK